MNGLIANDPDLMTIKNNQPYLREIQSKFLIKDFKNNDIYSSLFHAKFDHYRDIEKAKADLVFDSCILSDFHLISGDLNSTRQINSTINGLTLFPCIFLYGLLTQEY